MAWFLLGVVNGRNKSHSVLRDAHNAVNDFLQGTASLANIAPVN
jgi:hypothetical protein